jgi:hypothetical protein
LKNAKKLKELSLIDNDFTEEEQDEIQDIFSEIEFIF